MTSKKQVTLNKYAKAFGQALRKLRIDAGLSQENLALICDLDRTFISMLERGIRQPSLTTIFLLSKQLDIQPSNFIKKVESKI